MRNNLFSRSSEEIPNEVNQVVVRILEFCMEDDREMIHIEDGRQTIWGVLIQLSIMFIAKVKGFMFTSKLQIYKDQTVVINCRFKTIHTFFLSFNTSVKVCDFIAKVIIAHIE